MNATDSGVPLNLLLQAVDRAAEIRGDLSERSFFRAQRTLDADRGAIAFIDRDRSDKRELATACEAGLLICDIQDIEAKPGQAVVLTPHPKLTFARLVNQFWAQAVSPSIHPTAVIDPGATISSQAAIGALSVIGKATIGDGTVIAAGVVIYDGVTIGKNVTVNSGTVIGAPGFGYMNDEEGKAVNFPHIAGVTIEDDVEIGTNTTIDRGALSDTLLKRGCKIDNLVHVAHNVVVGEDAMVIANTMIGGSTVIGDGAYIAPSVTLRDVISIGAGATVGMGAVVTKSIPPNETWTGSPAMTLAEFSAQRGAMKKLVSDGTSR